jgi:hypothetical protein
MRLAEFTKAVDETPVFVPVFRVKTVPGFAADLVKRGDYVAYRAGSGVFTTVSGLNLRLGASHVEFLDYLNPKQFFGAPKQMLDAVLLGITQPHRS